MRQRGMIPLNLIAYGLIALAIIAAMSGIAWKIRESGKDAIRVEWAKANADERARLERERTTRNTITEKHEATNATAYADLDRRYRAALLGVRIESRGDTQAKSLSAAAGIARCPDGSANLAHGLAALEERILGLLERGDRAIARSETCRAWLTEQLKVEVR